MSKWQKLGDNLNQPRKRSTTPALMEQPSPPGDCPLCHGRGIYLVDGLAVRCTCMRERAEANRHRASGLTPALVKQTFDRFDLKLYEPDHVETARRGLNAARDFVRDCSENGTVRGLLFTGPVGSGKTFLASAIANALLQAGLEVLFVVVPDLLEAIKNSYSRMGPENTKSDLETRARNVPILILDDLGAHNYTDWTRNTLYALVNHRLNHELPTVITTNLSLPEMDEYLGERTISRIVQLCRVYRLLVNRDIRHVQARQK